MQEFNNVHLGDYGVDPTVYMVISILIKNLSGSGHRKKEDGGRKKTSGEQHVQSPALLVDSEPQVWTAMVSSI
jgi:hypothetical protein